MLHNKRAVVAETLTWIIATIIIIVILVFSIFITSVFAKGKGLSKDKKFLLEVGRDLFLAKSLASYLLTKDNFGETVFKQIKEEGDLNDFNGPMGVAIFKSYEIENYQKVRNYDDGGGKYLKGVWLTLKSKPISFDWPVPFHSSIQKEYFNRPPSNTVRGEEFNLGENKYLKFDFGA